MALQNTQRVICGSTPDNTPILKEDENTKPLTDACLISEAEKPLNNKKKKQVNEQGNQEIMITE